MKCTNHPGRNSVWTYEGKAYCQQCQTGVTQARARVNVHVQPKDCFVWYASNDNWQPIAGTGCAHWVAHQLGVRTGGTNEKCMAGYPYRVRTLIQGKALVAGGAINVRVNDIYVTPSQDHTGLVVGVTPALAGSPPGTAPTITIRHDSSRLGRVSDNVFRTYFNNSGSFYR